MHRRQVLSSCTVSRKTTPNFFADQFSCSQSDDVVYVSSYRQPVLDQTVSVVSLVQNRLSVSTYVCVRFSIINFELNDIWHVDSA